MSMQGHRVVEECCSGIPTYQELFEIDGHVQASEENGNMQDAVEAWQQMFDVQQVSRRAVMDPRWIEDVTGVFVVDRHRS